MRMENLNQPRLQKEKQLNGKILLLNRENVSNLNNKIIKNANDKNYCISKEKSTKTSTIDDKKNSNKKSSHKNEDSEDSFKGDKMHFYHVEKNFKLNYIKPTKPKNNNINNNYEKENNRNQLTAANNYINANNNEDELSGLFSDSSSENKNLIISKLDIELYNNHNQQHININTTNYINNINKDYKKEFERNIKRFLKKNQEDKKLNAKISQRRQSEINSKFKTTYIDEKILTTRRYTDLITNNNINNNNKKICINKNNFISNKVKQIKNKTNKNTIKRLPDNSKTGRKEILNNVSNKHLFKENKNNTDNKNLCDSKIKNNIIKKLPRINKESNCIAFVKINSKK